MNYDVSQIRHESLRRRCERRANDEIDRRPVEFGRDKLKPAVFPSPGAQSASVAGGPGRCLSVTEETVNGQRVLVSHGVMASAGGGLCLLLK